MTRHPLLALATGVMVITLSAWSTISPASASPTDSSTEGDPAASTIQGEVSGDVSVDREEINGAVKCEIAPFGTVCLDVTGEGGRVGWVKVRRAKLDPEAICNYQAELTIDFPEPARFESYTSPFHHGCSGGVAWFSFPEAEQRTYPHGTVLCGSFFEDDGVIQGNHTCVDIRT